MLYILYIYVLFVVCCICVECVRVSLSGYTAIGFMNDHFTNVYIEVTCVYWKVWHSFHINVTRTLFFILASFEPNLGTFGCPASWTRAGHFCYHDNRNRMSWLNASMTCQSYGSHLIKVDDPDKRVSCKHVHVNESRISRLCHQCMLRSDLLRLSFSSISVVGPLIDI